MTYQMDALDAKVNAAYPGKTVRKDLVQRIKKGGVDKVGLSD